LEPSDQQLCQPTVQIRPRRGKADNRIGVDRIRDLPWGDLVAIATAPENWNPRIG
jgi:hypothetical protein